MALVVQQALCQASNCKSISFSELTGAYSITNTGGYGTPNPALNTAISAVLEVTTPSNIIYTFNLFTESPSWPTTDTTQEFIIYADDLGGSAGDSIPDGQYTLTYTVGFPASVEYDNTIVKLLYCQAKCCVYTMYADIDDITCDCCADQTLKANKANTLYQSLVAAACRGNSISFNKILTAINKLCSNTNCSNCN